MEKKQKISPDMKQFLLSLIATTISIILTFGTSLWLENRKTEKEKREIVMMVMHDVSHSIDEMENADSLLRAGFDMQVAVAADPDLLEKKSLRLHTLHSSAGIHRDRGAYLLFKH